MNKSVLKDMDRYTTKKEALKAYRKQKRKQQKWLWGAFYFTFALIIICQFVINNYFDSETWPNINAVFVILSDLSIGCFTGFIIYVLVDFLPKTEKDVVNRDSIFFYLWLISETLKTIEDKFIGDAKTINVRQYEALLYGYLTINANPEDLWKEDASSPTPCLNEQNTKRMSLCLTAVNEQIDKLITAYGRNLENHDIELLKNIEDLKTKFTEIETKKNATNFAIYVFISDFHSYGNLRLRHLLSNYSIYKYCDYKSERVKINYKED